MAKKGVFSIDLKEANEKLNEYESMIKYQILVKHFSEHSKSEKQLI